MLSYHGKPSYLFLHISLFALPPLLLKEAPFNDLDYMKRKEIQYFQLLSPMSFTSTVTETTSRTTAMLSFNTLCCCHIITIKDH